MVRWKEVLEEAYRSAYEYRMDYGESLSLRGLFYILVSKNVIPNTVNAYKGLSRVTARARYRGEFPWYLIRDTTRQYWYMEPLESYPSEPLSEEELKEWLEERIKSYTNVSINPWEDQPYRIIVVVEKEALGALVRSFIEQVWEYGVYQVCVTRGYDSATDIRRITEAINSISEDQTPVILQAGDFDPSGEDIVRDFRDRIRMLSEREDIIFEKVAVTADQILDLKLPARPESAEEIRKIQRDPRYQKYVEKLRSDPRLAPLVERYGGLVRVELDALVALKPEDFKQILRNALSRYFDENIYREKTLPKMEELKEKAEEYRRQSFENLRKLLEGG